MTWKPEHLATASVDELVAFASQGVPTLRQMHAIRELAVRAGGNPELLRPAVEAITSHLGHRWRMGGLPVGYLGAKVLFEGDPEGRRALLAGIGVASPLDADDLLRWLSPPPAAPAVPALPVSLSHELLLHDGRPEADIRREISAVAGEAASTDGMPLEGTPAAVVWVELTVEAWKRLEQGSDRLSAALGTTVYWPAPEALGPLGPDLRVAVGADGRRWLVNAVPAEGGYRLVTYEPSVKGESSGG